MSDDNYVHDQFVPHTDDLSQVYGEYVIGEAVGSGIAALVKNSADTSRPGRALMSRIVLLGIAAYVLYIMGYMATH